MVSISAEGRALLRLHLVEGMGSRRIKALTETFGSARRAWQEGPRAWREALKLPPSVIEAALGLEPEREAWELEQLRRLGASVLTWDDEAYPPLLRETSRPPAALFVLGRVPQRPMIAVVGTRRPSPAGRAAAAELARDLAQGGAAVTSGMALGIDGIAHQAALDAGGETVAVVAHGLDHCYPPAHRSLMAAIAAQGAVVTEFPLGTQPKAGLFPVRNRIIAGLSYGVVVVEASVRSGAITTATWAAEEGREVFAVPGDVRLWSSKGPHRLLREGAVLTESAQDVWDALPHLFPALASGAVAQGTLPGFEVASAAAVEEDALHGTGCHGASFLASHLPVGEWVSVDSLAARTGAPPSRLLAELTRAELAGWAESDGHGRWRRRT